MDFILLAIHSSSYPFVRYKSIALCNAIDGSKVSSILSFPRCANHCFIGSAFFEGIDSIIRNIPLISYTSVIRYFPSCDFNFNCPIFSDTSNPSFIKFFFKSLQYFLGLLLPDITRTISIILI